METPYRRRLGVRRVEIRDLRHVRIFHDPDLYAGHPNRGGIWNFGDGEIVVAHRVKGIDYQTSDWKEAGAHNFSHLSPGQ